MKIFKLICGFFCILFLTNCGDAFKFRKVDAKEYPPDPKLRVKKNMEEGKGFRLMNGINKNTNYEFASSNPLWRATLESLDFMPLVSANYSGGIVITDWYSENNSPNQSIKISVRFLSNEIRSDALDIKIFVKECSNDLINCQVNQNESELKTQLALNILKKATIYEKEGIEQYKKDNPYTVYTPTKEADKKK
jgi:hypothetical protein